MKFYIAFVRTIALFAILMAFTANAEENIEITHIYLDAENGSDSNSGLTSTEARKSWSGAQPLFTNNSIVHIAPGVYEFSQSYECAAGATNISFIGSGRDNTFLQPAEGAASNVFTMPYAIGITFRDMTVRHIASPATDGAFFNGAGGKNLVVENCNFVSNSVQNGLFNLSYATNFTFSGCVFERNSCTTGGGMYLFRGSGIITNCVFRRNSGTTGAAFYTYATDATYVDLLVYANTGVNPPAYCGDNGGTYSDLGANWSKSPGNVFNRCTFADNASRAPVVNQGLAKKVIKNNVIDHEDLNFVMDADGGYDKESGNNYWSLPGILRYTNKNPRLNKFLRPSNENVIADDAGVRIDNLPVAVPQTGRTVNVSNDEELAAAIADIKDYDTIVLAPGTYTPASYTISDKYGIDIYGSGSGAALDGNGMVTNTAPVFTFTDVYGLVISNLTIAGVVKETLDSPIAFDFSRCGGTRVNYVSITNCVMCPNATVGKTTVYGVLAKVRDNAAVWFTDCNFNDNVFDNTISHKDHLVHAFVRGQGGYLTVNRCRFLRDTFKSKHTGFIMAGICNGRGQRTQKYPGMANIRHSLFQWCGRSQEPDMVGVSVIAGMYTTGFGDLNAWYCNNYWYNCTFLDSYGIMAGSGANGTQYFYNCLFHRITAHGSNSDTACSKFGSGHSANACNLDFSYCMTDVEFDALKNGLGAKDSYHKVSDLPLIDDDGRPTDIVTTSPLIDAGANISGKAHSKSYYMDFAQYADTDLDGRARLTAYLEPNSAKIDIGCYEAVPPEYRLIVTDYEVNYDGQSYGPSYEVVCYGDKEPTVAFSTTGEEGPWVAEMPKCKAAGEHIIWVKAAHDEGETIIKKTIVKINLSLSGDVYVDVSGTGSGQSAEEAADSILNVAKICLPGTVVHLKKGVYRFNDILNLNGRKDLAFIGEEDGVIIEPEETDSGKFDEMLVRLSYAENIVFSNITFRGAWHTGGQLNEDMPASIAGYKGTREKGTYGGAVYGNYATNICFASCTFTNCVAVDDDSGFATGGAMMFLNSNGINIRDSFFYDNRADNGGGAMLLHTCDGVLITNAIFSGNIGSSGAAIDAKLSIINCHNALFVGNEGSDVVNRAQDGRSNVAAFMANFNHCTFAANKAQRAIAHYTTRGKQYYSNLIITGQYVPVYFSAEYGDTILSNCWWNAMCEGTKDDDEKAASYGPERKPQLDMDYLPVAGSPGEDAGFRYWYPRAKTEVRDVYVNPSATAGGDGTQAAPHRTFSAALADLKRGDIIHLGGHVYSLRNEETSSYKIDGFDNVVIDGEGAVIDGGDCELSSGIMSVLNAKRFTLKNITFRNLKVKSTAKSGRAGIYLSNVTEGVMSNIAFERCKLIVDADVAFAVNGGLLHITTSGHVFVRDFTVDGFEVDALKSTKALTMNGIAVYVDSAYVQILGSRYIGCTFKSTVSTSTMMGIVFDNAGTCQNFNALVTGCGRAEGENMVGRTALVYKKHSKNAYYYNCTFAGNNAQCCVVDANNQADFYNCIFTDNAGGGFDGVHSSANGKVRFYNTYLQYDPSEWPRLHWQYKLPPFVDSGTLYETDGDPRLNKAGRYKLMSGSPLADSGTAQTWARVFGANDAFGNPRVVNAQRRNPSDNTRFPAVIDRGAHEFQPGIGFKVIVR